jgi:hypothetical protein
MIRAIRYRDHREFRQAAIPGSVYFDVTSDPAAMWFFCPCGCEGPSRIPVGRNAKPVISPSWSWNGSLSEPTLSPSVHNLLCGWHGWLRDGYWEAC